MRPRWRKVFADLWGNITRTILVVASIATGLFALGLIVGGQYIVGEDMRSSYSGVNPANILVQTEPFDQELAESIARIAGVHDVEGWRSASVRIHVSEDVFKSVTVKTTNDLGASQINQLELLSGQFPPGEHEVVFDVNKLDELNADVGEMVEVHLSSGTVRQLRVVGVVRDQTIGADNTSFFVAPPHGYVTRDTLEWLEYPNNFNQMLVTVEQEADNLDHIEVISGDVRNQIEDSGREVFRYATFRSSEHPNQSYNEAVSGVLFLLGFLVVFLSGFLITNTLSALFNQQVQYIGLMKSIGARRTQIIVMYVLYIFILGLISFMAAVPLSARGAYKLMDMIAVQVNFNLQGYRMIPEVVYLQMVVALILPQVAGITPVLSGSRVTVREALSDYGIGANQFGGSLIDRFVESVRGLSRPLLISLRNTFRRKSRLVLTLLTLALGGGVFIATFNVQISLENYVNRISKYFRADVNVYFTRLYRVSEVERIALEVPGVERVEGWAGAFCEVLMDGKEVGEGVQLLGVPAGSDLIEPIMMQGRWVVTDDESAIVLNEAFQIEFPDLRVGDTLSLKINDQEIDWVVVGFFQFVGEEAGLIAYTNYEYLARQIGVLNQAANYRIVAAPEMRNLDDQRYLAEQLDDRFQQAGFHIGDIEAGLSIMTSATDGLSIVTTFLLIMAGLTALVGAIGLMGTMSMNVMERTREIGVMRAIGAVNVTVMKLVMTEGIIIGLLSWIFGALLAFPISQAMSNTIIQALWGGSGELKVTATGFLVWLVIVLVLSALASVLPARKAARLTIREVLAYE